MIMPVMGIDLAGKEKNETGICIYFLEWLGEKPHVVRRTVHTDDEIMELVRKHKPKVVAVDAPFSFPKEGEGYFRKADRMLIERGFKVLSPLFKGMQVLVRRAMKLREEIEKEGVEVIETFPRAVQRIFGLEKPEGVNEHEFDAFLCALAAKAYLEGEYENLDGIILPL